MSNNVENQEAYTVCFIGSASTDIIIRTIIMNEQKWIIIVYDLECWPVMLIPEMLGVFKIILIDPVSSVTITTIFIIINGCLTFDRL